MNPHGLSDSAYSENTFYGGNDSNHNGTTRDSLGGAIINPAVVTVRYVDSNGNELKAPEQVTGKKTDGSAYLTDYGVTPSAILAPLDPLAPTAAETLDLQTGFAQYYRVGQSISLDAPAITGYDTPVAQTTTLAAEDNTITFTYVASSNGSDDNNNGNNTNGTTNTIGDDSLADTGTNLFLWIVGSVALLVLGGGAIGAVRRRG